MKANRIERLNELLRRQIGEALFRIVRDDRFDLAAATVTRVITSRDLRHARVLVSIRASDDNQAVMLDVLRGCRTRIQADINRDLKIKYTPRLIFELDPSIARGDDVLHILYELQGAEPAADNEGDTRP